MKSEKPVKNVEDGAEVEVKFKIPGKGEIKLIIKGKEALDKEKVQGYIDAILSKTKQEKKELRSDEVIYFDLNSLSIKEKLLWVIKNNFKYFMKKASLFIIRFNRLHSLTYITST